MSPNYLKKIQNARVYEVARVTPLDYAPTLSARTHNHVWLKREDLQPVFSFKCRGAYNKMAGLSAAELKKAWLRPRPATTPRAWRSPPRNSAPGP